MAGPSPPPPPPPPFSGDSVTSSSQQSSQSSEVSAWDSQELSRHAQCVELEEFASMPVNPSLLPTLNDLLLEVYNMLRPKPVDYEQRNYLVDVFSKMTTEIFGNGNGFPIVEAFGSFTMDLFTPRSDLDLSVNFSDDAEDKFPRRKRISVIRKFSKVLYSLQRDGIFCGVLPVLSARVPVLNVIDRGTGIECDISVENKDGMKRSMIFKFVSSLDERFQMLSCLVKFWAKRHDINSPRKLTMSSMSIISLVAFHLQTRHPPILPAFSALLKDGSDFASVERNILLFKGISSRNKESVAVLFVSFMSKLLSVESLWEHGLCASNFEASWISKTWKKGIGNLSVEDFLDRSQNFARSVGKVEMQKICKCLKECVLNLSEFMRGKMDTWKLKSLLFGRLNPDELVSKPRLKRAKRKRHQESRSGFRKKTKQTDATAATGLTTPAPAIAVPPILHQLRTQFSNHFMHKPWPVIVPSGFGYGLSVQLPVTPQCSRGLLGRCPSSSIQSSRIQLTQKGPLLPLPNEQTVGSMVHPYSSQQRIPPSSRS